MKTRIAFKLAMQVIMAAGVSGALNGCSGQQQNQDENLETTQQQAGDGQDNTVTNVNSEGAAPSEGDAMAGGADINSATTDDAAQLDATLNGAGAGNMASANPTPPMDAAAPGGGNAAAPQAAAPQTAAPAPAAGGPQAPVAGGRVRYVREGGVQVVNAPGGAPVFTLEQGDHPVTWEENGWLKLNTGMYVPAAALSDQGVGRPGAGRAWTAQ